MPEIVLVRHAESEANLAGTWQGRGNSALSPAGREQVDALTRRVEGREFDLVATSPLDRAVETAAAFGEQVETHDDLTEVDLGTWEGIPVETVASRDRELLRSIYTGGDDRFGAEGERMSEVAARAWAIIDSVAERVGPRGRAVVVTHGGVIDSVLGSLFPVRGRRGHRMVENASLTHLVGGPGRWRLARLNDCTHLGRLTRFTTGHLDRGGSVLALIRHGRTKANVEMRLQGQSCWGLDDVGEEQGTWLAEWYGTLSTVYSSPLSRATATARYLAAGEVVEVEGLEEIGMGRWEGLVREDIQRDWPDLARRIFEDGEDLRRGETGETWDGFTRRIVATIESLAAGPGEVAGVVAHGGVIRAYLGAIWAIDNTRRLHTPDNTSVTHIALTGDGPILCDYAVAPHLERRAVTS